MPARALQTSRAGARAAQVIPFPKPAQQSRATARLVRAMDGIILALRQQLAAAHQFKDRARDLEDASHELKASLGLYRSRLEAAAAGARDIASKSRQLAARMDICRRRLAG